MAEQKKKPSLSKSVTVFQNEQSYKIPARREGQLSQLKKKIKVMAGEREILFI